MKFVADMGISPKTVSFLKGLGHQAVRIRSSLWELVNSRRDVVSDYRWLRRLVRKTTTNYSISRTMG